MIFPARIKAGIANSAKLSTPLNMLWAANTKSLPMVQDAAKPTKPIAAYIGTPTRRSRGRATIRINCTSVIVVAPLIYHQYLY